MNIPVLERYRKKSNTEEYLGRGRALIKVLVED